MRRIVHGICHFLQTFTHDFDEEWRRGFGVKRSPVAWRREVEMCFDWDVFFVVLLPAYLVARVMLWVIVWRESKLKT